MEEQTPAEQPDIAVPAKTIQRCPNCDKKQKKGHKYCPKCGQRNTTHKVSFFILLEDLFREELHLNNKSLRSIKLLVFHPGALTRAYIEGRKKSMLTPTKLFIWTGFLLIALLLPTVNQLESDSDDALIKFNVNGKTEQSTYDESTLRGKLGNYFREQGEEANEHPREFMQKALRRFPFVLLAILPLFALFLKLMYRKRKMYFLEHLVFLLHFHAFTFLILSLLLVLMLTFPTVTFLNKLAFAILFIYLLISYKEVYRHRWPGTIIRGLFLSIFFLVTVPVFLILLSLIISLIL